MISARSSFKDDVVLVDPTSQVNAGLWTLFATTTTFLAARLWCKTTRRHGLWWDDHILIFSWVCYLQGLSSCAKENQSNVYHSLSFCSTIS